MGQSLFLISFVVILGVNPAWSYVARQWSRERPSSVPPPPGPGKGNVEGW